MTQAKLSKSSEVSCDSKKPNPLRVLDLSPTAQNLSEAVNRLVAGGPLTDAQKAEVEAITKIAGDLRDMADDVETILEAIGDCQGDD